MSLYYLILWNQVDILQKHFKKDHVHMRLWTRFYGMWGHLDYRYKLRTSLLVSSPAMLEDKTVALYALNCVPGARIPNIIMMPDYDSE